MATLYLFCWQCHFFCIFKGEKPLHTIPSILFGYRFVFCLAELKFCCRFSGTKFFCCIPFCGGTRPRHGFFGTELDLRLSSQVELHSHLYWAGAGFSLCQYPLLSVSVLRSCAEWEIVHHLFYLLTYFEHRQTFLVTDFEYYLTFSVTVFRYPA